MGELRREILPTGLHYGHHYHPPMSLECTSLENPSPLWSRTRDNAKYLKPSGPCTLQFLTAIFTIKVVITNAKPTSMTEFW